MRSLSDYKDTLSFRKYFYADAREKTTKKRPETGALSQIMVFLN